MCLWDVCKGTDSSATQTRTRAHSHTHPPLPRTRSDTRTNTPTYLPNTCTCAYRSYRQKHRFALSWSRQDKGHLLSGGKDNAVCLWDVCKGTDTGAKTLSAMRTFTGHTDMVEDVAWHPLKQGVFGSVGDDQMLMMYVCAFP